MKSAKYLKRVTGLATCLGMLITFVIPISFPATSSAASGLVCSSSAIKVSALHTGIFNIDQSKGYNSNWVGYRIDAIGVVGSLSIPEGSRLLSYTTNLTMTQVGSSYTTTYALLQDIGPISGSLSHILNISVGDISIKCTFTFQSVGQSKESAANQIEYLAPGNVSYNSSAGLVYEGDQNVSLILAVSGRAGVLEEGSIVSLSPTPKVTWPENIELTLIEVRWRSGTSTQMYRDQLWLNAPLDGTSNYAAEFIFKANVANPTNWQISPVTYVRDQISTTHSVSNASAQFSVIDRPDTDLYAATSHAFTGVLTVAGGKPPYEWSLLSGSLPQGFSLSASGTISGTSNMPGDYPITLGVKSLGGTSSRVTNMNFVIHVADAVITNSNPPSAQVGAPYRYGPFSAAGIQSPIWSNPGLEVAPGIIFGADGYIYGTPTKVGRFSFTISASGNSDAAPQLDAKGNAVGQVKQLTAARTFRFTVSDVKTRNYPTVAHSNIDLELYGNGSWPAGNNSQYGYISLTPNNSLITESFNRIIGVSCDTPSESNLEWIYSNEPTDLNNQGAISSSVGEPYKVDLNGGFCLRAEVLLNQPTPNQSIYVESITVTFRFTPIDVYGNEVSPEQSTNPLTAIQAGQALIKNSDSENDHQSICASTIVGVFTCKLDDMSIPKTQGKRYSDSTKSQEISVPFRFSGMKFDPLMRTLDFPINEIKAIKVYIEVSSNETESDLQLSTRNGDNGFGNGEDPAPGNSGGSNNANNSDRSNPQVSTQSSQTGTSPSSQGSTQQFCYGGQDNGFGNGEDTAPGNSLGNNNANNSNSGVDGRNYPGNSDQQAGNDRNASDPSLCDGTYIDYNNIAMVYLTQGRFKTVKLTYHSNGGTPSPIYETRLYPLYYQIVDQDGPTKEGSRFQGWFNNSCNDLENRIGSFLIVQDTDLYACWGPNPPQDPPPPPGGPITFPPQIEPTVTQDPEPVTVLPALVPIGNVPGIQGFSAPTFSVANSPYPVVTGNQGRFVTSSGLVLVPPGIPAGYQLAFTAADVPTFKGKALFSLTTDGTGIVIRSDSGWTGFLRITGYGIPKPAASLRASGTKKWANATIAGVKFTLNVQIYPDPAVLGTFTNTSKGATVIKWSKSPTPTVTSYQLYLNSQLICTTEAVNCTVSRLIGPKSKLRVVAVGGQRTRSEEMIPKYSASKGFIFASTVHFDTSKAILKPWDKKLLDKLVALIKETGFKEVYVEGHTDSRQKNINLNLSKARVASVVAYMAPKLKGVTFSGTALADAKPIAKGNSKLALALNRRADIKVR